MVMFVVCGCVGGCVHACMYVNESISVLFRLRSTQPPTHTHTTNTTTHTPTHHKLFLPTLGVMERVRQSVTRMFVVGGWVGGCVQVLTVRPGLSLQSPSHFYAYAEAQQPVPRTLFVLILPRLGTHLPIICVHTNHTSHTRAHGHP